MVGFRYHNPVFENIGDSQTTLVFCTQNLFIFSVFINFLYTPCGNLMMLFSASEVNFQTKINGD